MGQMLSHSRRLRHTWTLATVMMAACYLYDTVLVLAQQIGPQPSDFSAYYDAASAVLSGNSPFSVDAYIYSPWLSVLLTPLAAFDYTVARWIWFLFSHACLLSSAVLIWKSLGGDRLASFATATVWTVGGAAFESLALGQVSPLLLLLVAIAWRPGGSMGASCLGVAAATKLWPGGLLPAYGLLRDWRRLVIGVLTAGVLIVAPWSAVALYLPAPHAPAVSNAWAGTPALFNFSLPGIMLRLLDPPVQGARLPTNWEFGNSLQYLELPILDAQAALGVAVVTYLVGLSVLVLRWRRRHRPDEIALTLTALMALTLAASTVAWSHYQLLQYPGAAYLLVRFMRCRKWTSLTLVASAFLGLYQVPIFGLGVYLAQYGWTAGDPSKLWLFSSLSPICSLALFGICVREMGRSGDDIEANDQ